MSSQPVIFTPELLVRAFQDASALRVLQGWRDGKLTPVLNRDLLLRYTKTLKATGLSAPRLKRWLWWFSASDKSQFHPTLEIEATDTISLCTQLAHSTQASAIIHSDRFTPPAGSPAKWIASSSVDF